MPASRAFKWLSGVDETILDTCSNYEKIKHIGLGMLVLVPAVLGIIAMSFAISTLTNKAIVFLGLGLIWGTILLVVDRFMVSTFKKHQSILKDFLSLNFLLRLILSIGIGITVAHPLLLFILNDRIRLELVNELSQKKQEFLTEYQLKQDSMNLEIVALKKSSIDTISDYINCLEAVQSAEYAGVVVDINCHGKTYHTSGIRKQGHQTLELDSNIAAMTQEKNLAIARYNQFVQEENNSLQTFKSHRDEALDTLQKTFSTDYLSRTMALSSLEKGPEGAVVRSTKWFLIIFFIFLDILPVLAKVILPRGEYETRLEKTEENNISQANYQAQVDRDIAKIKIEQRYLFQKFKMFNTPFDKFASPEDHDKFTNDL